MQYMQYRQNIQPKARMQKRGWQVGGKRAVHAVRPARRGGSDRRGGVVAVHVVHVIHTVEGLHAGTRLAGTCLLETCPYGFQMYLLQVTQSYSQFWLVGFSCTSCTRLLNLLPGRGSGWNRELNCQRFIMHPYAARTNTYSIYLL